MAISRAEIRRRANTLKRSQALADKAKKLTMASRTRADDDQNALAAGLGLDEKEVKRLASMSQEKRIQATAK
jgi:hypothetical protein